MTFDAEPHLESLSPDPIHGFNLSVAFPAFNFFFDVPFVVEQNMFGHVIYFHPRGRRLGIKIAVLFFDPRVIGDNIVMAVQTFFHRRQTGMIRVGHVRVTVLTLYLFYAAVHIVAEGDGLLRADGRRRREPKISRLHR